YRYTVDDLGAASDTIRVNTSILEAHETVLTDYDVTPGTTYCYFYKVMRTNLSENNPSKTVAVTPLTSVLGDANGSGDVDVADVVTVVNYAAGMNPKPFIFEAADMNTDSEIDILDVVGVIRTILNPDSAAMASIESTALYYVEDGVLYVNTPVALAGVQVNLTLDNGTSVTAGNALDGFENTGAWIADNEYIFMAYSLSGRTLSPGTNALLNIGSSRVDDIRLSNVHGSNVVALLDNNSSIIESVEATVRAARGIYNILGIKIADDASALDHLPRGVYIVDGEKIVK
ncbi:MAG: dockerin type I domain-containing protein, partial [Bacteroides sp.]|nr:dockerin type I domain-containing protein [Bacteroides sp.]